MSIEGSELVTNYHRLKMPASDGKMLLSGGVEDDDGPGMVLHLISTD